MFCSRKEWIIHTHTHTHTHTHSTYGPKKWAKEMNTSEEMISRSMNPMPGPIESDHPIKSNRILDCGITNGSDWSASHGFPIISVNRNQKKISAYWIPIGFHRSSTDPPAFPKRIFWWIKNRSTIKKKLLPVSIIADMTRLEILQKSWNKHFTQPHPITSMHHKSFVRSISTRSEHDRSFTEFFAYHS